MVTPHDRNKSLRKMKVHIIFSIVILFFSIEDNVFAQNSNKESEGEFVIINGRRIWHSIAGKGEPLLIIPGGPGGSHSYFQPCMDRLADFTQLIYFDAFGRGLSSKAKNPSEYSFQNDVDEIEALRNALNLGSVNIYGHSYGGMVAQAYALKYPGSVRRLILANTIHSAEMWQKGNNDNWNYQLENQLPELWHRLDSLRKEGMLSTDSVYQRIQGEMPLSLSFYYDPSNIPDSIYYANKSFSLEVYKRIAGPDADIVLGGDLASVDFRGHLKKIKAPTLIIAGRFDRISIPKYSVQFKKFMPQAKFIMFEKSGHYPFIEEPELHAKILEDFLKSK
jgi:proline iminopeptidase